MNKTKCARCLYVWLPAGNRIIPRTGNLYMLDLGICSKCDSVKSRVRTATPGDQLNADIWGQQFELKRRTA